MHHVYRLVDPRNLEVRYIGITKDPNMRYASHLQCSDSLQAKSQWIKELLQIGLKPDMDIIESHDKRSDAIDREKYWIGVYQKKGASLLNLQHIVVHPLGRKVVLGCILDYYRNEKTRAKVKLRLETLPPAYIERREVYSIQELFRRLPITIQQVSSLLNIPECATIKFAAGEQTHPDRVRLWLTFFSWIYQTPLSLNNVYGISVKVETVAKDTSIIHPSF